MVGEEDPPDYDENGVDRTLVRAMLALTPAERARTHDALLADVLLLAAAGERSREATTYEDLLPDSDLVDRGGFEVRVLSLARLLEVKRKLARPKDQLMVLQIEATLDEQRRRDR